MTAAMIFGVLATPGWVSSADEASSSRRVAIPLRGSGPSPAPPRLPYQIGATLDGIQQTIVKVRPPVGLAGADSEARAWQVVVYFDVPLITPGGLWAASDALVHATDQLVSLGAVHIVLADMVPRTFMESNRDVLTVREALRDVPRDAMTAGEISWLRQRYLDLGAAARSPEQTSRALREEQALLEGQRQALLAWLSQFPESGDPKLLILVQNGSDPNPWRFYGDDVRGTLLTHPGDGLSDATTARIVASAGWMVLAVAMGEAPPSIENPLSPLRELTGATAGSVITSRRRLERELRDLVDSPIAIVEITGPDDERGGDFTLFHRSTGETLPAPRWLSASPEFPATPTPDTSAAEFGRASPILQLVPPQDLVLTGSVRFDTMVGRQRISEVAFVHDGNEVARDSQPPFAATIDLGPTVREHRVEAIAYSRRQRVIGKASLVVNRGVAPRSIRIDRLDVVGSTDSIEVSASVTSPVGLEPSSVEVFFNSRSAALLHEAPYTATIPRDGLRPTDFVRLEARYPDGEVIETARLIAPMTAGAEVDVNEVGLLALVTSRRRTDLLDLERDDFRIRQHGRTVPIREFARWDELPLTIGLVIDRSYSMNPLISQAQAAGERFLEETMRSGDRAFLVDFDSMPRLLRPATSESGGLLRSLEGLLASGSTALYDAIVFSLLQFEGPEERRALVVLTDGLDSASRYQPADCIRQARAQAVPIYLVVLGTRSDPGRDPDLVRNQAIAYRTGGKVFFISGLDGLVQVYEEIGNELRRQFYLGFSTDRHLEPAELEAIDVEVLREGVNVKTTLAHRRRGY